MKRIVFLILGFTCATLGFLGVLLPVMPGVVFFVAAAFFFSKSSKKMHTLLYKTPYIGKAILEWDTNRTMGAQAKITVIGLSFAMAAYPYVMNNKAYAIIMTNFFFICLFTVFAVGGGSSERGSEKASP